MRTVWPRIHENTIGTSWQASAACVGENPNLFSAVNHDGVEIPSTEEARSICRRCPARTDCLSYILAEEGSRAPEARDGIWGGLTPYERAELAGVTTGRKHHQTRRQAAV